MDKQGICALVREAEENYLHGTVKLGEYVEWDMHQTIETIDAYLNSRHISGPTDALGRDKPFFNIVTAATNIWYRATDLDRKNIRILPDKQKNTAAAFIATVLLQNWMKESRFGVFLNEWGRALARYGSAVVKFVERDDKLEATVVPWNRLIVDPVDFDALPRIEKIYKTPAQLKKMEYYDQEVINALVASKKQSRETLDGHNKDNANQFIELYEVHGELPIALLTDDPENATESEWNTYRQQMHVVSFTGTGRDFKDYTLFKGREKKDPYMITHLIKEDGRTLSIGAVEHLFDSQWMSNHTMKNMKDVLDLTSRVIFQTADTSYQGRNVLTAIETGDIFTYDATKGPLSRIANDNPNVTALQSFGVQWQNLASEITSTPDALKGNTLPSGTPYSLGAFLGAQANSLFEIMTENKGLDIEDMMRIHIIPFLKTKMNTKEELVAVLDDNSITELEAMYVPSAAKKLYNEEFKQKLLNAPVDPNEIGSSSIPSPYQPDVYEGMVRQSMASQGNRRSFKPDELDEKTWKEALSDFEMKAIVEVTNENTDKQAVLTTLAGLLQTIASNPAILQDPNAKMLFNAILTETGRISPIQMTATAAPTTPAASPPTGGTEGLSALTQTTNGQ